MELDRVDFQHKRKVVNIDGCVVLSQILDGRKEYVTEVHTREELFPKPEVRDVFLYEEGIKGGFDARICQRIFVVGRIEREPDSALVSVLIAPEFRDRYDAAQADYADRIAGRKDAAPAVSKPRILENVQVKGDTLEIHVKSLVKEDAVPLHKDDCIVYREGVLTVDDASGEEDPVPFGVYALKTEKDSLVLD